MEGAADLEGALEGAAEVEGCAAEVEGCAAEAEGCAAEGPAVVNLAEDAAEVEDASFTTTTRRGCKNE